MANTYDGATCPKDGCDGDMEGIGEIESTSNLDAVRQVKCGTCGTLFNEIFRVVNLEETPEPGNVVANYPPLGD